MKTLQILLASLSLLCGMIEQSSGQAANTNPASSLDLFPVPPEKQRDKHKTLMLSAEDLKSANLEKVLRFIENALADGGRLTIIIMGDSMAESYQTIPYWMVRLLDQRLGAVVFSGDNYLNNTMINSTNGVLYDGPNHLWFAGTRPLLPGYEYHYDKQTSSTGVHADGVGLHWVAHTNGGYFKLLVRTNGGPAGEVATLDGYTSNPLGEGRHFLLDQLAENRYLIQLVGITGTNSIIAPRIGLFHTNGIEIAFLSRGGISFSDMVKVPLSVREPIFASYANDPVLVISLVHDDPYDNGAQLNGLVNGMPELEEMYGRVFTNGHLSLYIGAPYSSSDMNSDQTADQNHIIKTNSILLGCAYGDAMTPSVSYEMMQFRQWLLDFVHLNDLGGSTLARILWNEMGLYAIGVPRTIGIAEGDGYVTLTHGRSADAAYAIQASTNLVDWLDIGASPPGSTPYSTNVPSGNPSQSFRLKLGPP